MENLVEWQFISANIYRLVVPALILILATGAVVGRIVWSLADRRAQALEAEKDVVERQLMAIEAQLDRHGSADFDTIPAGTEPTEGAVVEEPRPRVRYGGQILDDIRNMRKRLVLFGGIPSSLLSDDVAQQIGTAFHNAASNGRALPNVTVIAESEDALYRRSQYLDDRSDLGVPRDFGYLTGKRVSIRSLRSRVLRHLPAEIATRARSCLTLLETHLQAYLTITAVDDVIYMNPITHRRNSGTPTMRLVDKENTWYQLAEEHLRFHLSHFEEGGLVTLFDQEVGPLVDQELIRRAVGPNQEVYGEAAVCPVVVWGCVLLPSGQMLIHQRASGATDNVGLWDKSFGGHYIAFEDRDIYRTLLREMKEELFHGSSVPDNIYLNGSWSVEDVLSCANGKRMVVAKVSIDRGARKRVTPDGIRRTWNAAHVFLLIVPPEFPFDPSPSTVELLESYFIGELRAQVTSTPDRHTPDLAHLLSAPYFGRISAVADALAATE